MSDASYSNTPNDRGGRWIESPAAAGLRFVGWSDDIVKARYGRPEHGGWYLFPDGDTGEVARGAVYQLPARGGRPVYVEGLRLGSAGKSGWQDQFSGEDSGAAVIYLGERHAGDKGGNEYGSGSPDDGMIEAARGADREAEILAEHERAYQEAWNAANQWQELADEMSEERKAARQLVADMRAAIRAGLSAAPSICTALRAQLRSHADAWEQAREKRAELASQFYYDRQSIAEFAGANLY